MNWMMVEEYLKRDDRAVLPLGSMEQHAYLSLSVDSILAERLAVEAAEPLGVPVFPVLAYGITLYFRAFPGTFHLKTSRSRSSALLRCVTLADHFLDDLLRDRAMSNRQSQAPLRIVTLPLLCLTILNPKRS